jgi:hypothetical protein
MNTNKTKKGQLKHHGNPVMGGSGAFGLLGGANIVSAGKQILKSGIGSTNLISAGKQFLNSPHVNAVKGAVNLIKNVLKGNKKTTGVIKKTSPKSKPVDFKGPNPAHNTGAGGNSYPR